MTRQEKAQKIWDMCNSHYSVTQYEAIKNVHDKSFHWSLPRQMAMYLCKEYKVASLKEVGEIMGNKLHATVINGCNTISKLLETDKKIRSDYDAIHQKIEITGFLRERNRCYICGVISSDIQIYGFGYVRAKFALKQAEYEALGYVVINPVELFSDIERKTFSQIDFMNRCLRKLKTCDFITYITGYEESYNCLIEKAVAEIDGIEEI